MYYQRNLSFFSEEENVIKDKTSPTLPHYLILMDSIESNVIYDQLRYLAQEEIEAKSNYGGHYPKRITNLAVKEFFEDYRDGKYVMRPWLQNIYPRD